ncbi:hypothetical protein [Thioclava sp. GXIMD2076]|uniref:hypothetical protein n=1 Tax=Thioclava sp. GXIMD2076 TaxID=3131931 RepID=UPI0030CBE04B
MENKDTEARLAAMEAEIAQLKALVAQIRAKAVMDAGGFMRLRDEVMRRYD